MAVLVKGPFGLVPFVAAGGARALADRSARPLVWTMAGALAAAAPLGLFLAADRRWLHAGWWEGYLLHQVIASAEGLRPDGRFGLLAPLPLIAGRFWPGLPLVALGIVLAFRRDREARLLCSFCALMLAELCLPARKVWNHELVAYPGLALLAAAGARPLCARGGDARGRSGVGVRGRAGAGTRDGTGVRGARSVRSLARFAPARRRSAGGLLAAAVAHDRVARRRTPAGAGAPRCAAGGGRRVAVAGAGAGAALERPGARLA
jgi:hypothetical protein